MSAGITRTVELEYTDDGYMIATCLEISGPITPESVSESSYTRVDRGIGRWLGRADTSQPARVRASVLALGAYTQFS